MRSPLSVCLSVCLPSLYNLFSYTLEVITFNIQKWENMVLLGQGILYNRDTITVW
jgi:hypothetical protein